MTASWNAAQTGSRLAASGPRKSCCHRMVSVGSSTMSSGNSCAATCALRVEASVSTSPRKFRRTPSAGSETIASSRSASGSMHCRMSAK